MTLEKSVPYLNLAMILALSFVCTDLFPWIFSCLILFIESQNNISSNRNWGKQAFNVRFYVNLCIKESDTTFFYVWHLLWTPKRWGFSLSLSFPLYPISEQADKKGYSSSFYTGRRFKPLTPLNVPRKHHSSLPS